VPPGSFAADWIEQAAAEATTVGCGNGNFCPDAPLTRGQMAVFLARALGLSWPMGPRSGALDWGSASRLTLS
jgi:hypothetical protein